MSALWPRCRLLLPMYFLARLRVVAVPSGDAALCISRRHIFTTAPEDLDDDYDEYLFYPSENRMIHLEPFLPSPAPEQIDADHEYVSSSSDLSEVPWGSIQSLPHLDHLLKLPSSPTYSIDSSFVFPERVDDRGIRVLGYSKLFRTGLLAKPREGSNSGIWYMVYS
ncbi:hypothetical protein C8Q74DRAFT_1217929 [Fomes fomentarius]|nr:hypothetical protein C8Q74DRAFT_1217929 [Fomes fomentarius]